MSATQALCEKTLEEALRENNRTRPDKASPTQAASSQNFTPQLLAPIATHSCSPL